MAESKRIPYSPYLAVCDRDTPRVSSKYVRTGTSERSGLSVLSFGHDAPDYSKAATFEEPITHPYLTSISCRAEEDETDEYVEALYCNSIGCSDGYTPIKDAHDVECDDGKCKEKQCCEAFCSYYACPDNYTPVYRADTLLCDDPGCTTDKCCEKVSIKLHSKSTPQGISVLPHQLLRPEALVYHECSTCCAEIPAAT